MLVPLLIPSSTHPTPLINTLVQMTNTNDRTALARLAQLNLIAEELASLQRWLGRGGEAPVGLALLTTSPAEAYARTVALLDRVHQLRQAAAADAHGARQRVGHVAKL
jgi:hypothetical protein